jgi:hypothetical protein
MRTYPFFLVLSLFCSCSNNDSSRLAEENKELKAELSSVRNEKSETAEPSVMSNLDLLKSKIWILYLEKDPLMGLNKVPEGYYISRKFYDNGKGVESISTDTEKNPPEPSDFTYSLVGKELTITQDDGYVLNEELREISENKLVLYIKKFQNERTYKAQDKMNNTILDEDSNEG